MIPRNAAPGQTPPWQRILAQAVRDVDELWACLELPSEHLPGARAAAGRFPLRIPRPYLARIRPGDLHDPLLRQFLPLGAETRLTPVELGVLPYYLHLLDPVAGAAHFHVPDDEARPNKTPVS